MVAFDKAVERAVREFGTTTLLASRVPTERLVMAAVGATMLPVPAIDRLLAVAVCM